MARATSGSSSSVATAPDMPRVWVSIGSNIDRENNIRAAVSGLRRSFGDLILSSVYQTEAVGFEGAPFFNLVAGFESDRPAQVIADQLRAIEDSCGRVRGEEKFAPRTLDLDLLTYGGEIVRNGGLEIPRAEILEYDFVLGPLAEVAAAEMHPLVGRTYGQLWNETQDKGAALHRVEVDLG